MITTAEIIRYRMANERLVERQGEAIVPTRYGDFRMIAYRSALDGQSHIALMRGDLDSGADSPPGTHAHPLPARGRLWSHLVRVWQGPRSSPTPHRRRGSRRHHLSAPKLARLHRRASER